MGDVYLAEHTGQNRDVALKILPDEFLADAQRVQRFRQEARAIIALNHPNIVTVYDLGAAESGYFLATEGFTLWKVPIDGGESLRLTEKLALQPAVSPDGKQIAAGYRPDNTSSLILTQFQLGETRSLLTGQPFQRFPLCIRVETVKTVGRKLVNGVVHPVETG